MFRLLSILTLTALPQSTLDAAPAPVSDGFYVVRTDKPTQIAPPYYVGDVHIIGPWHSNRTVHYATLSTPTRQQIEAALATARQTWAAEKGVSRAALPKGWPLPSAAHDDNLLEAGPLPKGFTLPADMQRYKRAAFTQEIAVTNGRDRITPIPRLDLFARDNRWHVSGGLLGVGFRSDLYRNEAAAKSRDYVGNISVLNSLGYHQDNRGWRREFADGSKFLDVLSSDGKVFEVRQREKLEGRWNSEIVFEDIKARPLGYNGLTKSCVSCHNSKDGPGTGPYAGPLVLGSDTVFSYPFRALEQKP